MEEEEEERLTNLLVKLMRHRDGERESDTEDVFGEASQDNWVFSSKRIMVTAATAGERPILKLQIQNH